MDLEVSRRKFAREMQALNEKASEFIRLRGWVVKGSDYPNFFLMFTHPTSHRAVEFRFFCDDWDELPPSLKLFDPESGEELPWSRWPQGGWNAADSHPTLGGPFLCLPGIREFHVHTSHLNDKWEGLRGRDSYSLLHIVERVRQKFGETNG